MSQEYGPKEQYGRLFGDNRIMGNDGDNFFDLTLDKQVDIQAWSEGCPVREKVKTRYITTGEGLAGARNRYGEVKMARYQVYDSIRDINPALYVQLNDPNPLPRLVCQSGSYVEPVGEHEAVSVPMSHTYDIDHNNTPWGYAIPRLYLAYAGNNETRTPESSYNGLMLVEAAADPSLSSNPLEFLAKFGAFVVTCGVDIDKVLKTILSNGYLKEENTKILFKALLSVMKDKSPKLWTRYNQLKPEEKANLGIAGIELGD